MKNPVSSLLMFDQGGNVWQWNDAVVNVYTRGLRGGCYRRNNLGPSSTGSWVSGEANFIGFRVAAVP